VIGGTICFLMNFPNGSQGDFPEFSFDFQDL
jgi:hypothetical protein